ncbi:MAG: HDOD domain-containing protein [Desulfobacterales bacterium]|nr:HDOD domain-containing protein [Desulfobacterales bacterium]
MYGYVARQPIFNTNMKIYGYELLFREGIMSFAPDIDGDKATCEVLSNTFLTSDLQKYTSGKKAFINFTRNLIVNLIPLLFPNDIAVVEILENVGAEDPVIDACRQIAQKGYLIALDDFIYKSDLEPLIQLSDIIKIDFRQGTLEKIQDNVEQIRKYKKKLLAEKIESYGEFKTAVEMGFDYFQGYFFSKPVTIKGKKLSIPKLNLLRIIIEVNKREFNLEQLEKLISDDVRISYKLLSHINSAYHRRVLEISSIKQAIVLLGEVEIKRLFSVLAMTKLAKNKPHELIRISAVRANFCEILGINYGTNVSARELFTLGLFSLIDAIMDDSMENIMEKVPLSKNIKDALVYKTGFLSHFIELVQAYEKGNWQEVTVFSKKLNIEENKLPKIYLQALKLADTLKT